MSRALYVSRAVQCAKVVGSKLKPCVVAAVLETWVNGWCTSRRFQYHGNVCPFSSTGEDSIDHFACCCA